MIYFYKDWNESLRVILLFRISAVFVFYFSFGVILCVVQVEVGNFLVIFDYSCMDEVYLKIREVVLIFYYWLLVEARGNFWDLLGCWFVNRWVWSKDLC